jgi:hypothetical protein
VRKKPKSKVTTIPITKARVNLGALVRRVHLNKEYVILEKGGIPVVGLMDADEMEDYLEIHDQEIRELIRLSNEDIRSGRTRPARELLGGSQVRPKSRRKTA